MTDENPSLPAPQDRTEPTSQAESLMRCAHDVVKLSRATIAGTLDESDWQLIERLIFMALEVAAPTRAHQEDKDDLARVGPSVPCVGPTGTTAEPQSGAVTNAERTDG